MSSNLWTEKYRPKTFAEMRGQKHIVKRVEALVESKNLPHLMLIGPPGIGKTTLSLVIANALFGDAKTHNYLELNSSDERGIDVIRNKVKDFARTRAIIDVPFKVIFLDECDALTRDAQQALRRTMETYSKSCRFVLSCNYGSKIIDPIKSRCTIFKFKPLQEEDLKDLVEDIVKLEKIDIDEEAIDKIVKLSHGDVRQLENVLQSCAAIAERVTAETVEEVVSSAEPEGLKEALEIAVQGDFIAARSKLLDAVLNNGLSGLDVIKLIQKEVWDLELDDKAKLNIIEKCGETEFRIVEGADDFVQLESLLASFCLMKV